MRENSGVKVATGCVYRYMELALLAGESLEEESLSRAISWLLKVQKRIMGFQQMKPPPMEKRALSYDGMVLAL